MNIIVYTKAGCPWCNGVLDFLNEEGIQYQEKEVTSNKAHFDEMVRLSGQIKAPTLDIDGHILPDSDKDQVEKYLKDKGML
jgi:glutaredoxin 3